MTITNEIDYTPVLVLEKNEDGKMLVTMMLRMMLRMKR